MTEIPVPRILERLFDRKRLAILRLFLSDKDREFNLSEVVKQTGVPVATVSRILRKFAELGLLEVSRIRHLRLYMLAENNAVRFLERFLKEEKHILDHAVAKLSEIPQIDLIILHGRTRKDWANLFLIGNSIDNNMVKPIIAKIKDEFRFTISPLTITQEQFEQMTSMGLYSGEKRVLYRRLGPSGPSGRPSDRSSGATTTAAL